MRAASRHFDRMYNRTLASPHTVVWRQTEKMDTSTLGTPDLISEAKARLRVLQADLPTLIEGMQFSHPISYQAATLRELLRHRISDLAEAALPLLEQGRVVPAAILARAAAETTSLTYAFEQRVGTFLAMPDVEALRDFLASSLVGSRDSDHPVQAKNILGCVDKLDKEAPGFRKGYDALSEYAHPNWAGVLGAYGSINYADISVALGSRDNSKGLRITALIMASVLETFSQSYDRLADLLREFDARQLPPPASTGDA